MHDNRMILSLGAAVGFLSCVIPAGAAGADPDQGVSDRRLETPVLDTLTNAIRSLDGLPDPALARREVPVAAPARKRRRAKTARGVLSEVIRKRDAHVHLCYASALESHPRLQGRIIANLDVSPSGTVEGTQIVESTLAHAEVERCVQRVIRSLVFPPGATPKKTTVSYYWRFQPPPR